MRISDGSADVCSSDLPRVREAARRAAITRGPIVYCAEWPDAPGRKALDLVVAPDAPLEPRVDAGFMGGATLIDTVARHAADPAGTAAKLTLIDRKSTRLNSSHSCASRMPSSA